MTKHNIVLFMGGESGEYEVSLGSAAQVKANLDTEKYNVYPVEIRHGRWTHKLDNDTIIDFDRNMHALVINEKIIKFDCAFIAIHGTPGEDGKLQGYLDMAGIPYTSCDVTVSALTFNKYFCYDLASVYGAKVPETILLKTYDTWNEDEMAKKVGLPCFVKPNKSGSSVGVSKVYEKSELKTAIDKAFAEDNEVLVQQFIKGREMACGAYMKDNTVIVLPVTEIVSKKDFFDYEAKYKGGLSDEITPAEITPTQTTKCQELTSYLYKKFSCSGVVRFDYFLVEGDFWFLEVNTVPGMSAESIVPKQVKCTGMALKDFYGALIEEALKRK